MAMNDTQEFVLQLCNLTNYDEIRWEKGPLLIHKAQWNGWQFYTELLQYDPPVLEMESPSGENSRIQSYDCGISELNQAIQKQYKRFCLYEFSAAEIMKRNTERAHQTTESRHHVVLMRKLLTELMSSK